MSDWFLRNHKDGSIYGPVELLDLKEWATEGRIAPQDEVSEDQERWIPAPDLADLEMVWFVEVRNGERLGPFNVLAFCDLIDEQLVSSRDRVEHKETGDSSTVSHVLTPALLAERDVRVWQMKSREEEWRHVLDKELAKVSDQLKLLEGKMEKQEPAQAAVPPAKSEEIDTLAEQVTKLVEDFQSFVANSSPKADVDMEIAQLREDRDFDNEERLRFGDELQSLRRRIEETKNKHIESQDVWSKRYDDLNALRTKADTSEELLLKLATDVDVVQSITSKLGDEPLATKQEFEQLRLKLEGYENEEAAVSQKISQLSAEIRKITMTISDGQLVRKEAEDAMKSRLDQFEKTVQDVETATAVVLDDLSVLREQMDEQRVDSEDLEQRLEKIGLEKRITEATFRELKDELGQVRRLHDEELLLSSRRETELTDLIEQLQHEKEAVLIAMQQMRRRQSSNGSNGEEKKASAKDTTLDRTPRELSPSPGPESSDRANAFKGSPVKH